MTTFVDLDGVDADFTLGVFLATGKYPHEMSLSEMWKKLANHKNFFGTLPKMPDGDLLWDAIKHLEPTVLTGCPHGKWAPGQKRFWVQENRGHDRVITCFASDKHTYCKPGDILIDDRDKFRTRWEDAGGIFVHHLNSVSTIGILKEMGVI